MSRPGHSRRAYNELAGRSIGRLAGISDGIFAVGMTLLVLGLAVPAAGEVHGNSEGELWQALVGLGPSALTYAMSFLTLGIFWVGQQTQLELLEKSDRTYTWIQLAFLLAVTLIPFSTNLLARFIWSRIALVEYWLNIVVLGAMLLVALEYALRRHLFRETEERSAAHLIRGRVLIAQGLYAAATALCLFFPTWVSIALIALIQLNYVFAPRIPVIHRY